MDLSFTRDQRKRASFWKENSTAICYRICTVRCKRVAQVKNSSFQKFVRNRVNEVSKVLDPNRGSLSSPCKRTQLCCMLRVCCVLLGIVAQSFNPVKLSATCKRTQQLSTLLGEQCWGLLCPFTRRGRGGRGSEAVKILFARERDGRASISPFLSCNFL